MPSMSLPAQPVGKYNQWCYREPLVCPDDARRVRADNFLRIQELSNVEQDAYFFRELTASPGLEFVVFSNVRMDRHIVMANGMTLVPCFETDTESADEPTGLRAATMGMLRRGRFVYDGWLPFSSWEVRHVREAIRSISESLSLFSLRAVAQFDWHVKYSGRNHDQGALRFGSSELYDVERLSSSIESLHGDDRYALLQSVAWLAQGMRANNPAARFMFFILAIESLATHIEDNANDNSALARFKSHKMTKSERRMRRNECISTMMANFTEDNVTKLITDAYFDCVHGIKQKIRDHVRSVYDSDVVEKHLFDKQYDGESLYDIRNKIAHGSFDSMSESQRPNISVLAERVRSIAGSYIITILYNASGLRFIDHAERFTLWIPLMEGVFTHRGMYDGPTHMAELYS